MAARALTLKIRYQNSTTVTLAAGFRDAENIRALIKPLSVLQRPA